MFDRDAGEANITCTCPPSRSATAGAPPLPKTYTVKLSIALSVDLKAKLDRYAALHGELYGDPVDTGTLIPYMLEAFMAKDRVFKRS